MTPQDIDLVSRTFGGVLNRGDVAGRFFYEELFRIAPEVEPMFAGDIGWQGKKLIDTIGLGVYALRAPGGPAAALAPLGRVHARRYGVRAEHFEPVGRALAATLTHCLGAQFDAPTRAAWDKFYGLLAEAMIAAGREGDGAPAGDGSASA